MPVTYGVKLESELFLCNIEVSFYIDKPNNFKLNSLTEKLFKSGKSYFLDYINSLKITPDLYEKKALAIIAEDLLNLYFKKEEQVTTATTKISYFSYCALVVSENAEKLKKYSVSYNYMLNKWQKIINDNNIENIAYEQSVKKPPAFS